MVFIVTSFVLFVLDLKAPTHGALTAAGIGSLILGALVLFNSPATPSFQRVSPVLVITVSLAIGGIFAVILMFAIRAQRQPVRTGIERVVGKVGVVRKPVPLHGRGQVQVAGELWSAVLAEGEAPLPVGVRVRVVSVDGVHLVVEKASM